MMFTRLIKDTPNIAGRRYRIPIACSGCFIGTKLSSSDALLMHQTMQYIFISHLYTRFNWSRIAITQSSRRVDQVTAIAFESAYVDWSSSVVKVFITNYILYENMWAKRWCWSPNRFRRYHMLATNDKLNQFFNQSAWVQYRRKTHCTCLRTNLIYCISDLINSIKIVAHYTPYTRWAKHVQICVCRQYACIVTDLEFKMRGAICVKPMFYTAIGKEPIQTHRGWAYGLHIHIRLKVVVVNRFRILTKANCF